MLKKRDILSRKDKIVYLPLEKIEPNRHQPRRSFPHNTLTELAESIRENGVLQPITVRAEGKAYHLIAGERRLRAAHIAGLSEIPCIVVTADDEASATLALLENLQRENLNFFDEAEGISRLIKLYSLTQEEVAKKLGKTQSAISNKLRLLTLDRATIRKVAALGLSERHARALLRLKTDEERETALLHIQENNLNVRDTDAYIDSLLSAQEKTEEESKKAKEHYVIRDVRLFYNTVDRALDTMRRAGWRTDFFKDEDEVSINLSIKLFK
ncbi:MAG: ParB/RepB/Spo0J family partition protein [Oscillospiraceae bacterium]|nr:ParB/RepB/Spo0J family partition protein [Oscillospiraceae bacterium]